MPRSVALLLAVVLFPSNSFAAADYFVSPAGTPQGTGAQSAPWDLATALLSTQIVQPGDTVWLQGGVYRGGFTSQLQGQIDRPVTVRGVAGARVTLDTHPRDDRDHGLLLLQGSDVIYRDFEVTCSHPLRRTEIAGPWPADIRRGNIDVRGDRVSLVNLVIHDCASGVGFWAEAEGGEVYGCLIYNNGWSGPDRGHGHAIYAQNARGMKRMIDNVVFHQFGYGIHAYGSEKAALKGFEIVGNIAFENGSPHRAGDAAPGIMVGGGSPVERLFVRENVVMRGGIRLGYPWGAVNEDAECTDNYTEGLVVRDFRRAVVQRNTVVAESGVVQLEGREKLLLAGLKWNQNDYFVTDGRWGECQITEHSKARGLTFEEWRGMTGLDQQTRFTKGTPAQTLVRVRPNRYEPGRAHVAIVNPQGLPRIEVDLSAVLQPGQTFHVFSVKDVWGPAVVEGRFDGRPVVFPLQPVKASPPVGLPDAVLPSTEPHFAAFLVRGVDSVSPGN